MAENSYGLDMFFLITFENAEIYARPFNEDSFCRVHNIKINAEYTEVSQSFR